MKKSDLKLSFFEKHYDDVPKVFGAKRIRRTTEEWLKIFDEQRKSGLTIAGWCWQNGVPFESFQTAKKRIIPMRNSTARTFKRGLSPVKQNGIMLTKESSEKSSEQVCSIELGEFRITIPVNHDEASLTGICKALGGLH